VTLLGHFEGAAGARLTFGNDLTAHIRFADEVAARIRQTIEDHITRTGTDASETEPDPADSPVDDPSRYGRSDGARARDTQHESVAAESGGEDHRADARSARSSSVGPS